MTKVFLMWTFCAPLFFPLNSHASNVNTVFGVSIGEPLSLPECAFTMSGKLKLYGHLTDHYCFTGPQPLNGYKLPVKLVYFPKDKIPSYVKHGRFFVLEIEGVVAGIEFLTPGINSQQLTLEALAGKYGKPTQSRTRKGANLSGATFDIAEATWSLPGLKVDFLGADGAVDRGRVLIDSPIASSTRQSWIKQTEEAEAPL